MIEEQLGRIIKHTDELEFEISELKQTVRLLVDILDKKTEPENCYVNSWHVHKEWIDIKDRLELLED